MRTTLLEIIDFSTSLSATAKLITTCVIIVVAALACLTFLSWKNPERKMTGKLVRTAVLLFLTFTLVWNYLHHITGYTLKEYALVIKRPANDITINTKDILDCRTLTEDDMKNTSRSSGIGGLFGYVGNYHNPMVGDMTFYATSKKNIVLIHTRMGEAIIMSPDKPDEMAHDLNAVIVPNN